MSNQSNITSDWMLNLEKLGVFKGHSMYSRYYLYMSPNPPLFQGPHVDLVQDITYDQIILMLMWRNTVTVYFHDFIYASEHGDEMPNV